MKIHLAFGNWKEFTIKFRPKGLSFFLFALLSEKKEEKILCPLCVSSEAPRERDKRAVKNMR